MWQGHRIEARRLEVWHPYSFTNVSEPFGAQRPFSTNEQCFIHIAAAFFRKRFSLPTRFRPSFIWDLCFQALIFFKVFELSYTYWAGVRKPSNYV